MREGEELVIEPFQRLIEEKQLIGYPYDGFWGGMDTFKDKQELENLWGSGPRPGKSGKRTATKTEPANRSLPFRLQSFWIAGKQTEMGSLDAQDREYSIWYHVVPGLQFDVSQRKQR